MKMRQETKNNGPWPALLVSDRKVQDVTEENKSHYQNFVLILRGLGRSLRADPEDVGKH